MPAYIEYELEDGMTLLVEASEDEVGGVVPASRKSGEPAKKRSKIPFAKAFEEAKVQAKLLIKQIEEMPVGEAEIKFGLSTIGELGNMVVGKVGLGVNYEVTLRWKRPEPVK